MSVYAKYLALSRVSFVGDFVQNEGVDFNQLFPMLGIENEKYFQGCLTLKDFLQRIAQVYFAACEQKDERLQLSCLSVYMAFRDHFPSYMEALEQETIEKMDFAIQNADPKIIKLRRIAISQLAKVA